MSAAAAFAICELRAAPAFAATVSDRIWRAWWQADGFPLAQIADRIAASLTAEGLPLSLVAHRGEGFLGTASVIARDPGAQPTLSPWVAAVWVDPDHRGAGVGSALVRAAAGVAFSLGHPAAYLCAGPERSGFYTRLGWARLVSGPTGLDVFRLEA